MCSSELYIIVIINFKLRMFKHKSASFHDASVESQMKYKPPKSSTMINTTKRHSDVL